MGAAAGAARAGWGDVAPAFPPACCRAGLPGRGLPTQESPLTGPWKALRVGPYSPWDLPTSSCVPKPPFQGVQLVGAPRLVPGAGQTVGAGHTDSPPPGKPPLLLLPPPSCLRVFNQQNRACASLPKAAKCLPAVWDGSEVWEGFGFAKEHLAPVGAAVLCQAAAAPGFYFQPAVGACRSVQPCGPSA